MSSAALPTGAPRPPPGTVVFGPSANCTLEICPVQISVYGYRPSLAANISFIVLYALAALIHAYLGIRWKQWWFMGCMLVGAVNAIIGYVGRVMMYYNPFNFAAFILQISESWVSSASFSLSAPSSPYLGNYLHDSPFSCSCLQSLPVKSVAQFVLPQDQSTFVLPSTSPLHSRKFSFEFRFLFHAYTPPAYTGYNTGSTTSPPTCPASNQNSSTTSSSPAISSPSSSKLPAAGYRHRRRARVRSVSTSPSWG